MVTTRGVGLVFTLVLLITFSLSAQQLYIANEPLLSLQTLNLNTTPPQLSTLYYIGAKPDDLTLNSAGQLIYSVPLLGTVNLYDRTTGVNTTLVSGLKYARDLAIEPRGQTMLIAIFSPGSIVRFNFATGATTLLTNKLRTCDGIACDRVKVSIRVVGDAIVQIDPVAGTILNTLVLEPHLGINGADGLTYDSYTGSLWATHDGKVYPYGLLQIPVTAAGFAGGFSSYLTPGVSAPDGIKSDGKGNLYIGAGHTLAVYNIPTKK